jgi:hypothetical protein
MKSLTTYADNRDPNSLASRMRQKRFGIFLELVKSFGEKPLRILDVGGTQEFWEGMNFADTPHTITVLNLTSFASRHPKITSVTGDARDMKEFSAGGFDIVFSNSVIEHLRTLENQRKMADEVRRIGKAYFVQTPNFYFLMEPHFLFPGFQWLPVKSRVQLVRQFNLGWYERRKDERAARELVEEHRLVTASEMRKLFPDGVIYREKFMGITKSLVAMRKNT